MRISTRGRYALRFMVYMAKQQGDALVTLKTVSEQEGISEKYLEQIVGTLTKHDMLRSARGPQGGYALSRAASDYTVQEILTATENAMAPVACLAPNAKECTMRDTCPTLPLWRGLNKVITDYLENITLEQLALGKINAEQ